MTRRLLLAGVTATAASVSSTALVATAVWMVVTAAGRPGIAALSGAIVAVRALAVSAGLLRYAERLAGHDAVLDRMTGRRAAVVDGLVGRGGMLPRGRWVHRLVSDVDAEGDLVVRGTLPAVAAGLTGVAAVALAGLIAPTAAVALGAGLLALAVLVAVAVRRAEADAASALPDREALSAAVLELTRAGPDLAVLGGLDAARRAATDLVGRIAAVDRSAARAQAALRGGAGVAVAAAVTGAVAGAAHLDPARAAVVPVVASAVLLEAFALLAAAPKLAAARAARRRLDDVAAPERPVGPSPLPPIAGSIRSDPERFSGAATGGQCCSRSGTGSRTRSASERVPGTTPDGAGSPSRSAPRIRSVLERFPGAASERPGPISGSSPPLRSVSERVSGPAPEGSGTPSRSAPHLVLRDPVLDLDLPPGARVLLAGPSGCGKSTLLARLWGVLPARGTRTAGGVDVTGPLPEVGGLWQDAHVPRSTLRDAVRIARPEASDDEVRDALAAADLDADVLPDGLDGVLAENAENLSGGQRRRLLVARTLLADHPVVLFDEPVEGLAPDDADRLLRRLLTLDPPGRTVVVVSHRVPDDLPPEVVRQTL